MKTHGALQAGEAQHPRLVLRVHPRPVQFLKQREARHQALLGGRVGPVRFGNHIGRGSLEQQDLFRLLGDFRYELNGACPGADHRHGLAGEVHIVVPAGAVKGLAGEAVAPRQIRPGGPVELAGGGDQGARGDRAVAGVQMPEAGGLVEAGAVDAGAETDMRVQPVLVRAMAQVGENFRLRREPPRPVEFLLEGKRVQVRRHVAGGAGVGVVAPAAAHVVLFLEHHEGVLAPVLERNGHAQAAEAGADDGDLIIRLHNRPRR